ncbi:MAG: hypothetical protein L7H00_05845 [Vulcanisaeta sp.]|nr:hypothetical protein [Vulcanisaeta sp.]
MENLFEFMITADAVIRVVERNYRQHYYLVLPSDLSFLEGEDVEVVIGQLRFIEKVRGSNIGVIIELPPSTEYLLATQDGAIVPVEVRYPPRVNHSRAEALPIVREYLVGDARVTVLKNGHMVITFEEYSRYAIVLLHTGEDHLVVRKEIGGVVLKHYKRDVLVNSTETPFKTFNEYFRHLAVTNDFVLVYRDAVIVCKGMRCLQYTHNLPPKRVYLEVEEYDVEFMNFLNSLASKQF